MSFIDQTAKIFGNLPEFKFQAMLFGRDALYLEGVRPIKLESEEMVFKVNGALLTVVGRFLTIKELSGDCAAIVGDIKSVSVGEL